MADSEAQSRSTAVDRLKSLNRPGILGKSGLPSSRNLAKKFRHPRLVTDAKTGNEVPHPLDMMRGGPSYKLQQRNGHSLLVVKSLEERPRDTTGSFGDVSTFGGVRADKGRRPIDLSRNPNLERASRMVVTTATPGRSTSRKANKPGGLPMPKFVHLVYDRQVETQLLNLRNDIGTLDIMGRLIGRDLLSPRIRSSYEEITAYLVEHCSKDFVQRMRFKDKARESSIAGQIKSGHVHPKMIKSVFQRIRRAFHAIEAPKPIPYETPKPAKPFPTNAIGLG